MAQNTNQNDDINFQGAVSNGYSDPASWGTEFEAVVEDVMVGQNQNGQFVKVIVRNLKTGELARVYYSPFWFSELAKVTTTAKSMTGKAYKFRLIIKKTRSNLTVSKFIPVAPLSI